MTKKKTALIVSEEEAKGNKIEREQKEETGKAIAGYEQQQISVENMITQAIQAGTPVETMERILAMRKDLKAEWAKEQFDQAMAKFQSELPEIKKTKEVKNDRGVLLYKYAPLESIISQVKKLLADNGLSYTVKTEVAVDKVKSIVIVKHRAGHSEESEMETPLATKTGIMSQPQQIAATATFTKRYAFMNALGIMTGDEDREEALEASADDVSGAIEKLEKCTKDEDVVKLWKGFSKELKANTAVIEKTKEMRGLIKHAKEQENEDSQN